MRRMHKPILPISKKERDAGVKLMVFDGWTMKQAAEDKAKWFARRKHLVVVREKQRMTQGRGKVVGKWVSNKIYVAYIPKKKEKFLNELKQKQEPTSVAPEEGH